MLFLFNTHPPNVLRSKKAYTRRRDTMLHTINGFCRAAIGFALVDILNRRKRFSVKLSPLYLAFAAFCFSMTVGVVWEIFE